jgi:hypothetical protein
MTANIGQLQYFYQWKFVTAHKYIAEWTQLSRHLSHKYCVVTLSVCVYVCVCVSFSVISVRMTLYTYTEKVEEVRVGRKESTVCSMEMVNCSKVT